MRAYWRLFRLFGVTTLYSALVDVGLRFVPIEARQRYRARHQSRGSAMLCRIFGLRVRKTDTIRTDQSILVVSNHFGILEPFVLASVAPVAFAAKSEISRWPFFGWVTRVYGVIFVYRDRQHAVSDFIKRVRDRMESGVPVLVFPEGTTSADETVRPFKTGAFAAVAEMPGARIQPVYLRPIEINGRAVDEANRSLVTWAGGNESFVENLMRIAGLRSVTIEVVVGQPFDVLDMNRKALADEAYARVVALRDAGRVRTLHSSRA